MTWDQLAEKIAAMAPSQKKTDVTVYNNDTDEYKPVLPDLGIAAVDDGILDGGHPYLAVL